MKINISNVKYSSIVSIGEKITKIEKETGKIFLKLNRGVNAVTNINLENIIPNIAYNSNEFQLYAPNTGFSFLKQAILKEYNFSDDPNTISITPGGMPALDLVLQLLNVESVHFPKFYWGSYSKMATIRNTKFSFYDDFLNIDEHKISNSDCFLVCDPSNPTGIKMDDELLINKIKTITSFGAIIIFDCPYRKLFSNTDFSFLKNLKNVIVTESFSKWIGLPGLRLGFIYSNDKDFNNELNIRLLYEFNGVSSPSQMIVTDLLNTTYGKDAINKFQEDTVKDITLNINYLKENGYLAKEIYKEKIPVGIFAIINKSEDYLLKYNIGSVGLDKFVYQKNELFKNLSRVCVSVPHNKFIEYFNKLK